MSADCPSCTAALADPLTGAFHAGCTSCQERALAHSPAAWWAWSPRSRNRTRCDLINAMFAAFGADWLPHEARIKAWWDRIREAREALPSVAERTNGTR